MAARCSFCGEVGSPGRRLVVADGAAICPDCARLALDVSTDDPPPPPDLLVVGISRLVTNDGRRGGLLGWVEDAAVVIRSGKVSWVGCEDDLPEAYRDYPVLECGGRTAFPGFTDAGSWLIGSSHRRRGDPSGQVDAGVALAERMLRRGVTMVDVRVGATGDPTLDTYLLAAARAVGERFVGSLVVTWQCSSHLTDHQVGEVMAPTAARLARHAQLICSAAGPLDRRARLVKPLRPRLTCVAPNVDHRCMEDPSGLVSADAGAAVDAEVTVYGPSAFLAGRRPVGDAVHALSSECDPHGVAAPGLGLAMLLGVEMGGMSPDEAVWAATRGSAMALGEPDRGILRPGSPGDLVVVEGGSAADLVRDPDGGDVWRVVAGGVEIR